MKHLKLFKIFEQSTPTNMPTTVMVGPMEGGLLAIHDQFKDYLSKIDVNKFPIFKHLHDRTTLRPYKQGSTNLNQGMIQGRKQEQQYKADLFKSLIILVASFGDQDGFPNQDSNILRSYLKPCWVNLSDGVIDTMIYEASKNMPVGMKVESKTTLPLFKTAYNQSEI